MLMREVGRDETLRRTRMSRPTHSLDYKNISLIV